MTIKYKFTKFSEAKDCVVESVELIVIKEKQCRDGYMEYVRTSKHFTFLQQLKNYINTIQEPIEFIAESSINDVLMKEWIGEWNMAFSPLTNDFYKKTPKLNSNWTFKIE